MGAMNGNDYKRGWEEGRKAALNGEDKDFSRMGLSWKYAIYGNQTLDSYIDGYNHGYEVGLQEKHVVRKVDINNINSNDMDFNNANAQDFVTELRSLVDLNDFLVVSYCDQIKQVNGSFRGYITMMANTGVPVQACKEFADNYYATDESNFNALYERISNYDLPQIRKYIEQIRRQMIAATRLDIGQINLKTPSNTISSTVPKGVVDRKGNTQDYEKQHNALCDMMDFLVGQRDELRQTILDYEKYCQNMLNSGVPRQIVEQYIPIYAQFNISLINKTIAHIQYQDYPQLQKLQREIANSMGELGKIPDRAPRNM